MSAFERCFHCTEDVDQPGRWRVLFDGIERDVCCAGCEAVGNTIIAAGFHDYYRFRTEPAAFGQVPDSMVPDMNSAFVANKDALAHDESPVSSERVDQYSGWDAPEFAERYFKTVDGHGSDAHTSLSELSLTVEGLRCGACVWLLERSLSGLPGVDQVRVNLATERVRIRFDPDRLPLSALLRRGAGVGFQIAPYDAATREASETRQQRTERQRLFVAGLGAMQVMMYALPAYLVPETDIETRFVDLMRWASLVLTTPVMLYAAYPFFRGAWRDVRTRSLGMDVPVAIGLLVAFAASVFSTVRGGGEVWFDSVSMFVFLLLGARALEASARRHSRRALDALGGALPDMATRLVDSAGLALSSATASTIHTSGALNVHSFAGEQVPAARLVAGDLVRVGAGERVPADGRVFADPVAVDLSLLTGESVPLVRQAGEVVPGGAIVAASPVILELTHAARDSTLSLLSDLVERGSAERPALALLADRFARYFVATLLLVVIVVFTIWWFIAPERAPEIAIATLIVSCPCALSLATPAALAAATGRLTRARLLVSRGHTLESTAGVTDVVFDKTGTLTDGHPRVTEVLVPDGITIDAALRAAAQLEAGAAHPFARALREASIEACEQLDEGDGGKPRPLEPPQHVEHVTGHGLVARSATEEWRLGSARWCKLDAITADTWRTRSECGGASSEVFMTRRSVADSNAPPECLARVALSDPLRDEAPAVIQGLRNSGVALHLFSGDRKEVVDSVASELGIDDARASLSPEQKQAVVADLQKQGAKVLMVGDGLNDAPVMATADVSLAIGAASDLARSAADAVALGGVTDGALHDVERLLSTGRATRRVIRQNLTWAASYNAIMIPLTAIGLIPPWGAAIGMAGSSLLVSANALRLLGKGN